MHARLVRAIAGSALLISLLGVAGAAPAAAADCALSAPTYVNVGSPLTIEGSGFPASADIDVAIAIQGGDEDTFLVQSNASGAIEIALTPEPIDIGVTTLTATAGSACTAQVTYTVLAAGATQPASTPEPTTGDDAGAGSAPGAPSTDTRGSATSEGTPSAWILACALLAMGGASFLLSRTPRRR